MNYPPQLAGGASDSFSNMRNWKELSSYGLTYNIFTLVIGYPDQVALKVINGMLRHSNPQASVIHIHEKALLRKAPLPRLTASRFPPAGKLTGIQRSFL